MPEEVHVGDTLHLPRAGYARHRLGCGECQAGSPCGIGLRLMLPWMDGLGNRRRLSDVERIRRALVEGGAIRIPALPRG